MMVLQSFNFFLNYTILCVIADFPSPGLVIDYIMKKCTTANTNLLKNCIISEHSFHCTVYLNFYSILNFFQSKLHVIIHIETC